MLLEVIVQNHQEATQAERLGVERLELVSAISEGGLTPSYGTIKRVLESVSIPVQVMIRPHSNHFIYDNSDFAIIQEDIKALLELGGNRIVFGSLNEDNTINEEMLQEVIKLSSDLDITFNRAFDENTDQKKAYKTLSVYQDNVKRILTSGGAANCMAGKENLRDLVRLGEETNGPKILPGSGLTSSNVGDIHRLVGADQYHFGKAVRINDSFTEGFDREKINMLHEKLN